MGYVVDDTSLMANSKEGGCSVTVDSVSFCSHVQAQLMLDKIFACSLISATPVSKGWGVLGAYRSTCSAATALFLGFLWAERDMDTRYISIPGL